MELVIEESCIFNCEQYGLKVGDVVTVLAIGGGGGGAGGGKGNAGMWGSDLFDANTSSAGYGGDGGDAGYGGHRGYGVPNSGTDAEVKTRVQNSGGGGGGLGYGAGGGGGGSAGSSYGNNSSEGAIYRRGGGGGGCGECRMKEVTLGSNAIPVVIGERGVGGKGAINEKSYGKSGTDGGATSFGEYLTVLGGQGGGANGAGGFPGNNFMHALSKGDGGSGYTSFSNDNSFAKAGAGGGGGAGGLVYPLISTSFINGWGGGYRSNNWGGITAMSNASSGFGGQGGGYKIGSINVYGGKTNYNSDGETLEKSGKGVVILIW